MDRRHYFHPSLPPPPNIDEEIQNRKRRLYLIASLLSLPSIYFVWSVYGKTDPFIFHVYPFLIAEALLWSGALLWRRIPLVWIERFVFFTIGLFFFVKFTYYIYFTDLTTSWKEIETISAGMLITFIIGYIILPHRLALSASFSYTAAVFLVGMLRFFPANPELVTDLTRLVTRLLVIGLLTFVLAKVKEDVIEAQREAAYWEWQANIDDLTQLPNRRMISELIERRLASRVLFAILLIDLDDFKCYNDTYGHDTGDLILSRVAFTLKNNLRASDLAARWGGEEFLVLVDTPAAEADQLAERLRSAVEKMEFGEDRISISIGGTFALQNDDLHSLIKRSDTALYRAKAHGRNCVCWE
jgi:diguanylate cyclase (GGDEF)-like protein